MPRRKLRRQQRHHAGPSRRAALKNETHVKTGVVCTWVFCFRSTAGRPRPKKHFLIDKPLKKR